MIFTLAAAADPSAAEDAEEQPERQMKRTDGEDTECTERQRATQHTLNSHLVHEGAVMNGPANAPSEYIEAAKIDRAGALAYTVQDGRHPTHDEMDDEHTQQIHRPEQQRNRMLPKVGASWCFNFTLRRCLHGVFERRIVSTRRHKSGAVPTRDSVL